MENVKYLKTSMHISNLSSELKEILSLLLFLYLFLFNKVLSF